MFISAKGTGRLGAMLILDNVSAGYGGADVIRNISFSVKANENLSIIGPNGCGKTTLLRAAMNILPFRGSITMDGKPYSSMRRNEISLKIAMLSQNVGIYFAYTVFDTVMMGRYLHIKDRFSGKPSKEDIIVVMQSLEAVNLLTEKDIEITKLSAGQLQRVFLARTLAQEPKLILLDEPTSHLDLKCQVEIVEYLKKWSSEGNRAVVGVLHDINLAMQLSDRILVMKEGEIIADCKANEIVSKDLLNSVYGMDVAQYMKSSLKIWEK